MTGAPCPECGVAMAFSPHRAGDCLNPDCVACWYGPTGMSLVGLRKRLELELARGPSVLCDSVAIPHAMVKRLVDLRKSEASIAGARQIMDGVPLGQPILDQARASTEIASYLMCHAPGCGCVGFITSPGASTPEAIADRGGDPGTWPPHVRRGVLLREIRDRVVGEDCPVDSCEVVPGALTLEVEYLGATYGLELTERCRGR